MDDLTVMNDWLKFAQRDYDIAMYLNEGFRPLPTENICYNCQQAVEKTLKAILIYTVGNYPKTHDIRELYQLCKASGIDFGLTPTITRTLTRFATKSRYPDDVNEFLETDTEIGLKYAKQILTQAREVLDKAKKEAEQGETPK
ncbi:MAG: HEPN domain-containing protein [Defluviitaleaceae bacterium]|nr:HEPN domain-containing protein [Defluviitaleaceae bacterium]